MSIKSGKLLAPVLSGMLVMALALAMQANLGPLTTLRNLVFDSFQQWKPRTALDVPVRIVDIDNDSLSKIGQWPWPRTTLADLVQRLTGHGATAIVFDVVFAEPDRTSPVAALSYWKAGPEAQRLLSELPDHDLLFAEAIANSPAVMGVAFGDSGKTTRPPTRLSGVAFGGDNPRESLPSYSTVVANLQILEQAASGVGNFNFIPDTDGIVRRAPLFVTMEGEIYPSIVAEALRVAQNADSYVIKSTGASQEYGAGSAAAIASVRIADVIIPTDANGAMRLYMAPHHASRYVPASAVLDNSVSPELIDGHIVLIGTSASGLLDIRFSPLGQPVAGVELHAQALEQIITRQIITQQPEAADLAGQQFLVRPDWSPGAETLGMLLLSICLILFMLRFGALPSAIAALLAVITAAGGAFWSFSTQGLLFDPVLPSLGLLLTYLTFSILRHIQAEQDRQWIKTAFASYISPGIVELLIKNPEQLKLGGERREMTFLFTDLAGFTPLVESTSPEKLIPLLNEYLNGVTKIGFRHEGTLDKIVGDATTFYWNAPTDQPDHASRAIRCALDIDEFSESFRRDKNAIGVPIGITRIGVNTGNVIIGNMGGDAIFDYSAHGDAVNTAARMESVNKQLGTRICVAGNTTSQMTDFVGRPIGELVLKGRSEAESCFQPLSEKQNGSEHIQAYRHAYGLMEQLDPGALNAFRELLQIWPEDSLAKFHRDRLVRGEQGVRVVFSEK
ncbi:MAG: adenylate/guanylate cyclase domain-containing protein [Rhodospirillales bacterium]